MQYVGILVLDHNEFGNGENGLRWKFTSKHDDCRWRSPEFFFLPKSRLKDLKHDILGHFFDGLNCG